MNTLYFGLYSDFSGVHSSKGILTVVKPTSTHNCGILQIRKTNSGCRIINWVSNPATSTGQGSEHDLINGHHYRKVV